MSPPSEATSLFAPLTDRIAVTGIAHVAIGVADLARARAFYCDLLGFANEPGTRLPACGEHVVVRTSSGQRVALCRLEPLVQPPDMGRHVAYGIAASLREEIVRRASARGVAISTYKEDRPAEETDNCYLHDPDGNRIQLVVADAADDARVASIDHVAIQAIDLEWEEDLFVRSLGLPVEHITGWRTSDYKRARLWGEGKEDMAPGTRRWDDRFGYVPGKVPGQTPLIARPNMQLFVKAGAQTFGIFLAYHHYQQPPEKQVTGVPRVAFAVARSAFDAIAERFHRAKLPTDGPVRHPATSPYAESLFAKDCGANFLEFCCIRDGAA